MYTMIRCLRGCDSEELNCECLCYWLFASLKTLFLLEKFIFQGNKAFLCVILLQFYKSTRYYYHHFITVEMEVHVIMAIRRFYSLYVLLFINVAQGSRIKDIS